MAVANDRAAGGRAVIGFLAAGRDADEIFEAMVAVGSGACDRLRRLLERPIRSLKIPTATPLGQ